jgi:hypothetical protein
VNVEAIPEDNFETAPQPMALASESINAATPEHTDVMSVAPNATFAAVLAQL